MDDRRSYGRWAILTKVEDLDLITDELYEEWGVPYRLKVRQFHC